MLTIKTHVERGFPVKLVVVMRLAACMVNVATTLHSKLSFGLLTYL